MLNRSASLAMSTSVLKALPGKLDIKRHSPSTCILFTLGGESPESGADIYDINSSDFMLYDTLKLVKHISRLFGDTKSFQIPSSF